MRVLIVQYQKLSRPTVWPPPELPPPLFFCSPEAQQATQSSAPAQLKSEPLTKPKSEPLTKPSKPELKPEASTKPNAGQNVF